MTQRKLGPIQLGVLESLKNHGEYPGSGWTWDTHSRTTNVCESLLQRGLVTKNSYLGIHPGRFVYRISREGIKLLMSIKA